MSHRHPSSWSGPGDPAMPTSAASDGLDVVRAHLRSARRHSIGFPGATDIDFSAVLPLHTELINNVGDPESEGHWHGHTKGLEREIVATFAELFGGSAARSWGYVTAGGSTEGVLHGLWLGRERFPTGRVYHCAAAHYCVAKAAHLLRVDSSVVAADAGGEMRYDALAAAVHPHRDRPALVVATAGTTMTEAVDDVAAIHEVLDDAGVRDRHIVVDAALAGPALALDATATAELLAEHGGRGRADADSVCFSSHKSLGTPHVGGVTLARRTHAHRVTRAVDYLGGTDSTIAGSRSGQVSAELWHVLHSLGLDGLRARAAHARAVAEHAVHRLTGAGWPAWRHPHAWTVVLREPPTELAARWSLPVSDGWSHIVTAPGITTALIDTFVAELRAATNPTTSAAKDVPA